MTDMKPSGTVRVPFLARYEEALTLFGDRVHAVGEEQWADSTPCADWTVRDLVNHLVTEQLWVPPLLRGDTVDAVGGAFDGDQLGSDPAGAWDAAAGAALDAFVAPDALDRTVHLSYGDADASFYCAQMATDLTVHAWDLSRAIGVGERLPEDLVNFVVREVTPHAADLERSGLFAAPVEPPPDADVQTKLLCLMGRRP